MPVPALCALNDIMELKYVGFCDSRPVNLVTRWRLSTLVLAQGYATEASQVLSKWNSVILPVIKTSYLACLPPSYTLNLATAQRIAENLVYKRSRKVGVVVGAPGTWAIAPLTADNSSSAGVIERFAFSTGKTEQGDVHIGPLAAGAMLSDLLTAPIIARLTTLAGDLTSPFTTLTGNIYTPCGYRRGTLAFPGVPGATDWVGFAIGTNVRSQKRRLQKIVLNG